jgi:transcriptional regulator with XRE-family HTH domain
MTVAPMNPNWFAERLRELREAAGLSRDELAARAGFKSKAGVRNLEQGLTHPSLATLISLCQALGVTCEDLLAQPSANLPPPKIGRPSKPEAAGDQAGADRGQGEAPAKKAPRKPKGKPKR